MTKACIPGEIWSATPTPFTQDLRVDIPSVHRLVEHHLEIGAAGLMLAGTCGEGPWLRESDREALIRATVECNAARLRIAVHVSDNSAARVLDHIESAARWGVEIAVVAAPYFFLNATPERQLAHYREVAQRSTLPVGFYDRGAASSYLLPESHLAELLAEPRIVMVKDSSANEARRGHYLAAKKNRPELQLFSGDEFTCTSYLAAGYDGLLLGGAIFNARLAQCIVAAMGAGDRVAAEKWQSRMIDLMHRVYGGPKIECWLTGLKELLVQMGVFSTHANHLGYPLTDLCRAQIRAAVTGADGLGFPEELATAANRELR